MSATTTTSSTPAATSNTNNNSGGPTSSPLLFFVALGFGVVFTNLWIIVGVKYCFRYNQRNRQARQNPDGEPIDLAAMPRPHRRRREKKLMSMEEVNERFPLMKYKAWRATREHEGLPTTGGITTPLSRTPSLKEVSTANDGRQSTDTARPSMALSHHRNRSTEDSGPAAQPTSPIERETTLEKGADLEKVKTAASTMPGSPKSPVHHDGETDDDDDDDPIRTAVPPEMLAQPGDTCAICLDSLEEDDDVRGLTCGHAFHASCLDPWLTSRRACCPLCKADYYVPKPRPEGDNNDGSNAGRHATVGGLRMNLPASPQAAWMSTRAGIPYRPRILIIGGPRSNPTSDGVLFSRSARGNRSGTSELPTSQPPNEGREAPTWRSRLQSMGSSVRSAVPSIPNPLRRRADQAASGNPPTTPSALEAGNR